MYKNLITGIYSKIKKENKFFLLVFTLLFFFIVYIVFYNLGKAPLENWDEAWYAEVTKQMLRTKEFIILNWNHAVWLEKPPMYMWLSALVSGAIGLSEFSVRFTSAFSGGLTIIMVAVIAYRRYGLVPSLLAFSAVAFNNLYIWRTRSGNIDAFVSLLIFLTYILLISKNKYKYPLLGLVFACIFLTKASLVGFPLLVFFVYEFVIKFKEIKNNYKEYLKLFAVFFSLSGIWLFLGYLKIGYIFVNYYLFLSDQGVGNIDFTKFNPDYIQYAYYSLQRRFFWVLLIGTGFALWYIRKQKDLSLLLLYSFLLLFELSFTAKSNNWYLMPSMPFWSLLIAYGTYNVIKLFRSNIIIIVLIVAVSSYVSYKTFIGNILPIIDASGVYKQAESSKAINKLTKDTDIIIRLDHLYPTTIYYSDRQVLASPEGSSETKTYWISRVDLVKAIEKKKIKWLIGTNRDVQQFQTEASSIKFKLIPVNEEEVIVEAL